MDKALELIRGSVRPILTLGITVAFIAACFSTMSDSPFAKLEALTFIVVGFWFKDRAVEKKDQAMAAMAANGNGNGH